MKLISLSSLIAALLPAVALAVPVIPGATGFGIETPAGRGGTVYRVTNLNATGAGSLTACVDASGPRVCIFETSGTIKLTEDLIIRRPNITIAGQTAPSPGITIAGAGLKVWASDVLVQHLRIRPGDGLDGPPPVDRDALSIGSAVRVSNVVIDHVSLSWGTDETASAYWDWDNVTFLNTIFGPGLDDSIHPATDSQSGCPCSPHGFGPLFQLVPAAHRASMAIIGSLFVHQVARNPLSLVPRFVFANNVVYNAREHYLNLYGTEAASDNSIVGNVFIGGPSTQTSYGPILIGAYTDPLRAGSRIYVADNATIGLKALTSDPWSAVSFQPGSRSDFEVTAAPVWPTGFVARRTAGNVVLDSVLTNVGARPADRDVVDRNVVNDVSGRTGQIINCVAADGSARCAKNAGGWPTLVQRARALTVPANPNTVGSDGYTNLERWLHGMAAEVEGRALAPAAPGSTQVR